MKLFNHVFLGLSIFTLIGCASERAILGTKTNVGIDVDTRIPPRVEVSMARYEFGILPTYRNFEKDGTFSTFTSFIQEGGFFTPEIQQTLIGGDAAFSIFDIENKPSGKDQRSDSSICIQDDKKEQLKNYHEDQDIKPKRFIFFTDTAFGLKVSWSGATAAVPDSFTLGYNRNEFASPPIYINKYCTDKKKEGYYNVRLPSYLAIIDNKVKLDTIAESGIRHEQFFATGSAATKLADRQSMKQYIFEKNFQESTAIEASSLNKDLIEEIIVALNDEKINSGKKEKILDKAIDLELINNKNDFKKELEKNEKKFNYSITTKLNELRVFAKQTISQ